MNNVNKPIDSRSIVNNLQDLIDVNRWTNADGDIVAYIGMTVSVVDDETIENNNLYVLESLPVTEINNWSKIISDDEIDKKLQNKQDLLTAGSNINIEPLDNKLVISATDTSITIHNALSGRDTPDAHPKADKDPAITTDGKWQEIGEGEV